MKKTLVVLVSVVVLGVLAECNVQSNQPQSASGVKKATVQVPTNSEGLTTEQQNIRERLLEDNKPGSMKHLYVISAYSGQVIIYSTVRGKVTSGGKRLNPTTVSAIGHELQADFIPVDINGTQYRTSEVLQDDGSYGSSSEYLYWWDTKGVFHQHYVSGGQIIHVSNQPLAVKGIIINMEITQKPKE
jgi:hypothetical protein